MRARTRLSADEWARRLDACMRMVLRDPASYPPATVWWAEWRRHWLATRAKAVSNQWDMPLEKLEPLRRRPAAPSARAGPGFAIWAPGRRPVPPNLKGEHMAKTERKRKRLTISQPTDLPTELAHDPVAREFYRHLCSLLRRSGRWRDERAHLVALAAQWESRRRRAEEVLDREGLIVRRNGELRAHPAVRVELMAVRGLRAAWRDLDLLRSREPASEAEAKWSEFV